DVGNTMPTLSIEEVEHALSMRFSVRQLNQFLSIISRRSQRHLLYPALSYNNTNINNSVSNRSDIELLETQVQVHLSLLSSDATSTPHQILIFHPQKKYVNMHSHTNLYTLFSNNPDQNIIHVLVKQLPGSETQII
ncbi:3205_t:CDS:2, partial [Dentiscutata heterogama]